MVLFLLFVLVIALIITFAILAGKKNRESYKTWGGPMKKNCPTCCGNVDRYLGPQLYKNYCPNSTPPAFENTQQYDNYYFPQDTDNAHNFFAKMQENFVAGRNEGKSNFEKQITECKEKGLKPAYNPDICTENNNYKPYSNCKCVDDKNNCKECYPPINLDKYQKD